MRRFWTDVTEPLLRQRRAKHIVEIGSQSGQSTRRLLELCREMGAHADIIDPFPPANEEELQALLAEHGSLHLARSLEVLPTLDVADVYLIDGDHNWYTVHHELLAIDDQVRATKSRHPLILMHDIGWPYAYRDLYYDPDSIPTSYRHAYLRGGVHPGRSEADPKGGFNRHLAHARVEGGPRNGVRTAIDDFLALRPDTYRWWSLGVFHGYGFLVPVADLDLLYAHTIVQMCTDNATLLSLSANVERDRVADLIALEATRYELRTVTERERRLASEVRQLESKIQAHEKKIEAIESSRGYRVLEEVRNVRRRLRRLRS